MVTNSEPSSRPGRVVLTWRRRRVLQAIEDYVTGAGIFSGDWVVVRQQFDPPRDGDIVAAALDGIEVEGTVKTYKKAGGRSWLMPHTPAYMPIAGDRAEIRGKVVAVLRWLP